MLESKFYAKMRPHFKNWGEHSRVENSIESGMPDIFYCFGGEQGWIETKVEKQGWVYFEIFQPNWIRRYTRVGAKISILVMREDDYTILAYRGSQLNHGLLQPHKKKRRAHLLDLGTPALTLTPPYNWLTLRLLLTE